MHCTHSQSACKLPTGQEQSFSATEPFKKETSMTSEFTKMAGTVDVQLPERTFRMTGAPFQNQAVLELLQDEGFYCEPLDYYRGARLLKQGPLALGASIAARFGWLYIQDASSMLPPLLLHAVIQQDRAEGQLALLDMCSSPGGKSTLLATLEPNSFVLANEPGIKRLATLRRNISLMNVFNCPTTAYPGEGFPLPDAGGAFSNENGESAIFPGWDYILLDPPCSGWGTVEKNPRVMELWQGEKVKPLISLQRALLREAARMLRPGGCIMYSTCTVNPQENEEQVMWALENVPGLSLEPLAPPPGFLFAAPLAGCDGVLRVDMEGPLGQGFFIAALRKDKNGPQTVAQAFSETLRPNAGSPFLMHDGRGRARDAKGGRKAVVQDVCLTLPLNCLDDALLDSARLPSGRLVQVGNTVRFQLERARAILSPALCWQGFPLGKSAGAGLRPRSAQFLRGLMPEPEIASERGAVVLNADDPALVRALMSGRSLDIPAGGGDAVGLYYKGLPLCRLKRRGTRVML